MDINRILEKQRLYQAKKSQIPKETLASLESAFEVEYAHNSTAIEGNTLSLIETKMVLEDGIAIGGKPLREIYDVINHNKAYQYVKECIAQNLPLTEKIVKDIHAILMTNIMVGGIYRNVEIMISGASHTPPAGHEMYAQIKNFYIDLDEKDALNAIELSAWTHAEFVRIHPFVDGNGRTARLLMNYQLLGCGFPAISISTSDRYDYYTALDKYASHRQIDDFVEMIATLEEKKLDQYLRIAQVPNITTDIYDNKR